MGNLDLRIAGKYRLQSRIGGGSFGDVYIATDVDSGDEVAIKLEHISVDPSLLEREADVYRSLSGGAGIPRIHAYKTECEYNAMVFDLLGPSLEDLFNYCGRELSLKTVLMLADQLLHRLEYIHSRDVIHRDIKPENCLMGMGRQGNLVYVTDLGLATERRAAEVNGNTGRSLHPKLVGTARFASVNGHLGAVQHRCDDLESLGYMLLYFLRGSLPWQGLKATNHEQREELILEKKKTISMEDLCEGQPKEFAIYFNYIRSLGFDDKPKYSYLRKTFRDLFKREKFDYDHVFDWTVLKYLEAVG